MLIGRHYRGWDRGTLSCLARGRRIMKKRSEGTDNERPSMINMLHSADEWPHGCITVRTRELPPSNYVRIGAVPDLDAVGASPSIANCTPAKAGSPGHPRRPSVPRRRNRHFAHHQQRIARRSRAAQLVSRQKSPMVSSQLRRRQRGNHRDQNGDETGQWCVASQYAHQNDESSRVELVRTSVVRFASRGKNN